MSSTSGFVGSFIGAPHAGGGVGGADSPGSSAANADFQPMVIAAASINNVPLVNGTPSLLATTVVVPNDGVNHLLLIVSTVDVTTTEVGGAVQVAVTSSTGHAQTVTVQAGGTAGPALGNSINGFVVGPGSNIAITQTSALTGGAATISIRVLVV